MLPIALSVSTALHTIRDLDFLSEGVKENRFIEELLSQKYSIVSTRYEVGTILSGRSPGALKLLVKSERLYALI